MNGAITNPEMAVDRMMMIAEGLGESWSPSLRLPHAHGPVETARRRHFGMMVDALGTAAVMRMLDVMLEADALATDSTGRKSVRVDAAAALCSGIPGPSRPCDSETALLLLGSVFDGYASLVHDPDCSPDSEDYVYSQRGRVSSAVMAAVDALAERGVMWMADMLHSALSHVRSEGIMDFMRDRLYQSRFVDLVETPMLGPPVTAAFVIEDMLAGDAPDDAGEFGAELARRMGVLDGMVDGRTTDLPEIFSTFSLYRRWRRAVRDHAIAIPSCVSTERSIGRMFRIDAGLYVMGGFDVRMTEALESSGRRDYSVVLGLLGGLSAVRLRADGDPDPDAPEGILHANLLCLAPDRLRSATTIDVILRSGVFDNPDPASLLGMLDVLDALNVVVKRGGLTCGVDMEVPSPSVASAIHVLKCGCPADMAAEVMLSGLRVDSATE